MYPEPTKLKALADVFGVTVDYLLNEDDPPEVEADSKIKKILANVRR